MKRGRTASRIRLILGGAILAVGAGYLALGAVACGAPSVDGDPLTYSRTNPPKPDEDEGDAGSGARDAQGPATDAADASSTFACTDPNLVVCFPFEGSVTDKSANAIAPAALNGTTFVVGKHGQAVALDANSAIRFGPNPVFNVATATIEAWVKRAAGASDNGVIFDADERFSMTVTPTGGVLCRPSTIAAGAIPVDQWTHIACTFDGTQARLYIAGALVDTQLGTIGSSPNASEAIGGNSPSGEPFVGAIDSFRIYRVARPAAEIAAAAAP